MNSMERQKDMTLKELPRSVGAQYATGEEWRNNIRMKKRQSQSENNAQWMWLVMEEQYCMETWNVRSMNQGKLEVVKQEMARVNINILGISEINALEWVNLTQMTLISTTVGKNPLEEME